MNYNLHFGAEKICYLHVHCLKTIKHSVLIESGIKNKSKLSVAAFILKLLEIIKLQASKSKLIIWSDGPSSEFKNKFICYFLFMLSKHGSIFHGI